MPIRDAIRDSMNRLSNSHLRAEDPYLTYQEVTLVGEDIACLKEDWLTDNNISFWEAHLEQEELSNHPGNTVQLLRPSMVQLLKTHPTPRDLKGVLPPLAEASHIFLPINDSRQLSTPEAGSHWSLLVVGVADRIAFHYDSMSSGNLFEAQMVCSKLQELLNFAVRFVDLTDTPQQENGSDCGVHVCWAMKHLLVRRLLSAERKSEVDMSLGGKRLDALRMRKEMLRICEAARRKEGRGSRSPGRRREG